MAGRNFDNHARSLSTADILGTRFALGLNRIIRRLRDRWGLIAAVVVGATPTATGMAILFYLTNGNTKRFGYVLVNADLGAFWILSFFYLLRFISLSLPIVLAVVLPLYCFRLVQERRFRTKAKIYSGAATLLLAGLITVIPRNGASTSLVYAVGAGVIYFHLVVYFYHFVVWRDSGDPDRTVPRLFRRTMIFSLRFSAIGMASLSIVLPVTRLGETVPIETVQFSDNSSSNASMRGTVVSVDDSRLLIIRPNGELSSIPIDKVISRFPETDDGTAVTGQTTVG